MAIPVSQSTVQELLTAQKQQARQGKAFRVELLIEKTPDLAQRPDVLLDLIYNEVLLREDLGEIPTPLEYQQRFPALAQQIHELFEVHALLEDASTSGSSSQSHETFAIGADVSRTVGNDARRIIRGRYELLEVIGTGGMGVVYRARDLRRDSIVALKTMKRIEAAAIYRFKNEFRMLRDVSHPNLVTLHELLSDEDSLYIVMEYVDGVNFLQYVRSGSILPSQVEIPATLAAEAVTERDDASPLATEALPATEHADVSYPTTRGGTLSPPAPPSPPPPQSPPPPPSQPRPWSGTPGLTTIQKNRLRECLRQLAEGVHSLHASGKLHRDIKPPNVKVSRDGRVVLLDFGLAIAHHHNPRNYSTEGNFAGTFAYMSPEQTASSTINEASDWYSMGVMLYEALTGRLPFLGSLFEVANEKQRIEPAPPREIQPDVPEDLNALCVDLLRREPGDRPSGRDILRRLGSQTAQPEANLATDSNAPSSDALFVGRERHHAALQAAFEEIKGGRTVLMLVGGHSGVGKSLLVQRFLDELVEQERGVVLSGRCYERESVPYKALDSIIDALSRYLRRLPEHETRALLPRDVGALLRVFPVLRRVEAIVDTPRRSADVPDPHELRRRALSALRELLARLGDRCPLVLAIDDLQWGDMDSLAVVTEILRPPDPPVLLLVGCYRVEDIESTPFLQAILAPTADLGLTRHDLAVEPLSLVESEELVRRLVGGSGPSFERQVAAIARESAGNPLFVVELARAFQHETNPTGAGRALTLDEVLLARVARLPEDARRLLEVVAISGQPLPASVAWSCLDRGGDDRTTLALLRAWRLVRGTTSGTDGEQIETYHDRVRETIVTHLDADRLREIHRRLARAFEATGQADPEVLGTHFFEGGDPERAGDYFGLAAERAAEALAFDRAAKLYRLALEHRKADDADRHRLRVALGDSLANAGRGKEAAAAYLDACTSATVAETLELRRRAAMQYLISGHIDEGLDALRVVLASVGMSLPRTPFQARLSYLWCQLRLRWSGLRFKPRDTSEITPADLRRIDVCWSAGIGLSVVDWIRGADFHCRGLLLALRAGDSFRVARSLAMEAAQNATGILYGPRRTAELLRRSSEMAEQFARENINQPRKSELAYTRGMQPLSRGTAVYLEGRWREALEACDEAVAIFRDECTGVAWELDTAHAFALWALSHLGHWAELGRRYPVLIVEARERGDKYSVMNLSTYVNAIIRLAADEPIEGREEVRRMMAQWSRQGYHVQHNDHVWAAAMIELYLNKGTEAHAILLHHWPALSRSQLLRVRFIRVAMSGLRGRAAVAAAVESSAPQSLRKEAEDYARRLDAERMPWATAQAFLIRAALQARQGRTSEAVTLLDHAARAFDSVEMALCAAVARRRIGELQGGEHGRTLREQADAWMRAQSIRNPSGIVAMYAPGFD